MNVFLIVLFIVVILILILFLVYVNLYNKINESIIRIEEAESRLDMNIREKFDLLNGSIPLIKNEIELDDKAFKDLIKLRSRKVSNFETDRVLTNTYNEFLAIYSNNKKVKDNDEIYKIKNKIELIDEELITLKYYYNANITNYNLLISKFPTLIIARIKNYKEKLFFDLKNMKDDNYEDFKL